MRLTELIEGGGPQGAADIEISGLSADSRQVRPGYLFAALPGLQADGADFVDDARRRGAVAVLAEPRAHAARPGLAVLEDDNPRRRLAFLAARFFGPPPAVAVAVTGTNGKTSVASFTRQIWRRLGLSAASVGTLGVVAADFYQPLPHTTPEPVTLHSLLADLTRHGVDHVAIEASSHGLEQHRLDAVPLRAAAFTNLSRDHMDYHPTVEAYLAAKLKLFGSVLPEGGIAVLNADCEVLPALEATCRARRQPVFSYGSAGREVRLLAVRPHGHGQRLQVVLFGQEREIDLPLAGDFQAGNALCALALVAAAAGPAEAAQMAAAAWPTLAALDGVPGRMQWVASHPNKAPIYVDYAHTPDALRTVLTALRPHTSGRLAVVFGCGGDRDRGKRPLMGRLAGTLADRVIVTDDNPRGEEPAAIRQAILAAVPAAEEIADRGEAIAAGIAGLGPDDVLVIAGKGHEQGQIVGTMVRPFDDAGVVRAVVARLRGDG